MKYLLFLTTLLWLAAALAVQAQVPAAPIVNGPPGIVKAGPAAPPASPAEAPMMAASVVGMLGGARGVGPLLAVSSYHVRSKRPTATNNPRLPRLTQLQFDRRPSSILKAWAQPAPDKKEKAKQPAKDPLTVELDTFQKNVTLGNWPAVKTYLAGLPADEGKAAYGQLLQSLQNGPANQGMMPNQIMMGPNGPMQRHAPEPNSLTTEDVIGLAAAAPGGLDKDRISGLGAILKQSMERSIAVPDVVARFKQEVDKGAGKTALTTRQAAQVLMAAGEPVAAGTFLPGLDKAVADKDAEGLNLLARHFVGVHQREKKTIFLERAWAATQAALTLGSAKTEDKEDAVRRAVELAPKLKEELGQQWLDQSFTSHPDRGMEILAAIGALASTGMDVNPMMREERLKTLQLQKTAVEALLKTAPQLAGKWRDTLTLLAVVWMREADYTKRLHNTHANTMRRGRFSYWWGDPDEILRQQNQPLPIHTEDLLRTRPEKAWIVNLEAGPRSKLFALLAHLYLKAEDEKKAFPFIEELAPKDKEAARELINEFLNVWTTSHDPNATRQNDNFFYFFRGIGYNGSAADSIPLTRSKQERNLLDLAGWVDRMRKLPIDRIDEDLLVNAFTKCHSSAEVYRLEAIEKVFGPLPKIKPRTLATLIQNTRSNLAGIWREPAEQQKKKTNRKQKDIQVEVLHGYELAGTVVGNALKQFPDDWSLHLARAALLHDETNYRQEVAKTSDYSKKREEAMTNFHKAAVLYADQVRKLSEDEQTIAVYQQWFYASLGACDLAQVDEEKLPDARQSALIRKALRALPAEVAERHMEKMAESLAANLNTVKPPTRYRYLKNGFDIVGDTKQAASAKKIFDYYKDLVTEIKLDVVIDGSDKVGHKQPFGVFVNIRHTREIERESGGFGRYLQNLASTGPFGYMYNRPPADYRDRFQTIVKEALKEQFEVVSITFQSDKVHSRALPEYGWRVTPYAYLLLKPRGPQVDKIPPLHIDLDFQDTTADYTGIRPVAAGYVILPIESPAVPIDATLQMGEQRPVRKLQITQILDERQADQGRLGLEIKATGIGLVGAFDDTLSLVAEGFEVVQTEDQGVSVAKFDEDNDAIAVVSERTWLVNLRAKQNRVAPPRSFRFASAKSDAAEMTYQRYQDADLAPAEREIALEHEYEVRGRKWLWIGGAASAVLAGILLLALVLLFRRRPKATARMQLPQNLTPFTLTVLLRHIQQTGRLVPADKAALDQTIADLERRFFAGVNGSGEVNLREIAEDWNRKVKYNL